MREVPLSDSNIEMRVFRTYAEALDWLGLNEDLEGDLSTDTQLACQSESVVLGRKHGRSLYRVSDN